MSSHIELLGGPECGTVLRDAFFNEKVTVRGSTYRRRDRGFDLGDSSSVKLENGNRIYDYVNPFR